jgi:hypothetical protein
MPFAFRVVGIISVEANVVIRNQTLVTEFVVTYTNHMIATFWVLFDVLSAGKACPGDSLRHVDVRFLSGSTDASVFVAIYAFVRGAAVETLNNSTELTFEGRIVFFKGV